jgi:hypothetical protein
MNTNIAYNQYGFGLVWACGEGSEMRRGVLPVGAGAVVVAAAAIAGAFWVLGRASSAVDDGQLLRTADGAAGCLVDRARVTCSNDTDQRRARPVVLQAGGGTSPRAKLMSLDWASAPVLRPGHRRTFGSVRCLALSRQLICYTADGSGLAVSAARVSAVTAAAHYP